MRYRRWSTISLGGANGAAGGRKKTGGGEGGHGSVVGLMTMDTLDEHSVTRDEGGRGWEEVVERATPSNGLTSTGPTLYSPA